MKYKNDTITKLKNILNPENDTDNDVLEYIEFLEDRNNKLASTLLWYQEKASDCGKLSKEGEYARVALNDDGGQRAKDVLSFSERRLN